MHISKFKISNYKSFRESREVELEPGFSVIVGKNNSGKTALTEVLSLDFQGAPHKSQSTVPYQSSSPKGSSEIDFNFFMDRKELKEALTEASGSVFVPRRKEESKEKAGKRFVKWLRGSGEVEVSAKYANGSLSGRRSLPKWKGDGRAKITVKENRREFRPTQGGGGGSENVSDIAARDVTESVYHFDAQRLNVGECRFGSSEKLSPDASNLAEVLNVLQGNRVRYNEFNECVSTILPGIEHVSVHPKGDNGVQVKIWNISPETEREDLAIPLSESGTGIGQVLAMLYVVLNSDQPRTIIIDEPQSFLHPGALRRLIGIMKQHLEHQYIMTTHAPSVITAADPSTLLLTRLEGMESKIETLDVSEAKDLQRTLAEVGARLSDVFGADNILWVEGRTEEECFPMILEEVAEEPLLGTQILGVRHTGDFESEPQEAVALYKKLSEGRGLRPPAVGFIFDREDRDEQELADLRRRDDRIQFTDRRMYENYLLNSEAIAAVLTDLDQDGEQYSGEEVQAWMEEHSDEFDTDHAYGTKEWKKNVHAANLLEELFADLSDTRVTFDKVRHAPMLTEHIIDQFPEELQGIADVLTDTLEQGREMQDA